MSKVVMSVKNLDDLKEIDKEINELKSSVRRYTKSMNTLADFRRGETPIKDFLCISGNMNYRYEVDGDTKNIIEQQLAVYQPDFIRVVEMRLESIIRGLKNQISLKQKQLDNFFKND